MEMGHERGIFALAGLTASGALLRGTHAGLWRRATGEESENIVDREGDDVFAAVLGEPVNGLVLLRRAPDLEADGGGRAVRRNFFFFREEAHSVSPAPILKRGRGRNNKIKIGAPFLSSPLVRAEGGGGERKGGRGRNKGRLV